MSDFSFNSTAGTSQDIRKPNLPGNKIHSVTFAGCELKDIQGVKDPNKIYKQIILKFENGDGQHEITIWEPKPEDFNRTSREVTRKDGNRDSITSPSNVENLMLLLKHAIDTINPKIAKQIDSKEKSLTAPDFDSLRKMAKMILDEGKGVQTRLKLVTNKNGEATIPFFSSLTKDKRAYVNNNFIGDKVAFSAYEIDKIKKEASARPTDMSSTDFSLGNSDGNSSSSSDLDLDFDVSNDL